MAARNEHLNEENEELMDQIRDLRENLHMREEANARRRVSSNSNSSSSGADVFM